VAISFNSFRLTAIAFAVAGLSAGLSMLALFGYPFGINAIIGVIWSVGVSINAALIVLSGLQDDPRAAAADRAAMVDVVAGSARHITLTTITTFGGFLPLILGGGRVLAAVRHVGRGRCGLFGDPCLCVHPADVCANPAPRDPGRPCGGSAHTVAHETRERMAERAP